MQSWAVLSFTSDQYKVDLDMSVVEKEGGVKVHTQCVNCQANIPLVEINEHSGVCVKVEVQAAPMTT